jgi:hypothetical protein
MRAKEKADGQVWQRRYFTAKDDVADPVLTSLGPAVSLPGNGDADKTGGLWRFDSGKLEAAHKEPSLVEEDAAKLAKELLGQ